MKSINSTLQILILSIPTYNELIESIEKMVNEKKIALQFFEAVQFFLDLFFQSHAFMEINENLICLDDTIESIAIVLRSSLIHRGRFNF